MCKKVVVFSEEDGIEILGLGTKEKNMLGLCGVMTIRDFLELDIDGIKVRPGYGKVTRERLAMVQRQMKNNLSVLEAKG